MSPLGFDILCSEDWPARARRGMLNAASVHLSPSPISSRPPEPASPEWFSVTLSRVAGSGVAGSWAARGLRAGRFLARLRALAICLSFALVCAPLAPAGELAWSGRALATLVAAAVSRILSSAPVAAQARGGRRQANEPVLAARRAPWRAERWVPCVARRSRERAPAADGRHLYLEQRALLC